MKKLLILLYALLFLGIEKNAAALKLIKLNSLEKMTVGPHDNYQAVLSPDGKNLVFTQSLNLATRIHVQEHSSDELVGFSKPLLSGEFDSKDPAISPGGKYLAYTTFYKAARGRVCFREWENKKETCVSGRNVASEQPFWLDNQSLLYLRKNIAKDSAELVLYNIKSKSRKVIIKENVFSYAVHRSSKKVVFSTADPSDRSDRILKNTTLGSSQAQQVLLHLPGLSGFPRFSQLKGTLFFSQFVSDSNKDGKLDANDNSIIYSIPLASLGQKQKVLPRQVTSYEHNCNYPIPQGNKISLTCAFEGSLDIYTLPLDGEVPLGWDKKRLLEAMQVARSQEERILILNTLLLRYPRERSAANYQKLFSLHVTSQNYAAAKHILTLLKLLKPDTKKSLNILLTALDLDAAGKVKQKSISYRNAINNLSKQAQKIGSPEWKNLTESFLDLMQGSPTGALRLENTLDKQIKSQMYGYFVYYILRKLHYPGSPVKWENSLLKLVDKAQFTEESRLYFVGQYFNSVEKRLGFTRDAETRISRDSSLLKNEFSQELLKAEVINLKMNRTEGKEGVEYRKDYFDFINKYSKKYFIKRHLYTRGLLVAAQHNANANSSSLARNYFSAIKTTENEFSHAMDIYRTVAMDFAYQKFNQKNYTQAGFSFMNIMTAISEGEAFHGFLESRLITGSPADRKAIDVTLKLMKKAKTIGDNMNLVQVIMDIRNKDLTKQENLDLVVESLEKLEQVKDVGYSPTYLLFLRTYLQQKKLLLTRKDIFTLDKELAQQIHKNYMIALEYAKGNLRMEIPILTQLGFLHFENRNYGLASKFLAQRATMPFLSKRSEFHINWWLGKAYFYSNQLALSEQAYGKAVELAATSVEKQTSLHRHAYAQLQTGQLKESLSSYENWLSQYQGRGKKSFLAFLNAGIAALRLSESSKSLKYLKRALFLSKKVNYQNKNKDFFNFDKDRYEAHIYSFLSKAAQRLKEKEKFEAKRFAAIRGWKDKLEFYAVKESDWQNYTLKSCHRLSLLAFKQNKHKSALKQMRECQKIALEFYGLHGSYAQQHVYRTFVNSFHLANAVKQKPSRQYGEFISTVSRGLHKEWKELAQKSVQVALRWYWSQAYWAIYQKNKLGLSENAYKKKIEGILNSAQGKFLKENAKPHQIHQKI